MVQPSRGSVVRRRLAATSVVDDASRLSLSTRTKAETMDAKRPPLDEVSSLESRATSRRRRRRRRDRDETSSRVVETR